MNFKRIEFEYGDEERAFLQQRIGFYAQVSFGIVVGFFLLDLLAWLVLDPMLKLDRYWPHQVRGMLTESAIAAGLLAASWVVKRGTWSVVPLYAFDGAVALVTSTALGMLVYQAPHVPLSIELMIFMAIQSLLFVHAAVVPAPPIRTLLIHTIACAPLFFVALDRARALPENDPIVKWGTTVTIAIGGLTFAVVGAILSRVLFRLRLTVRKAMRLGQYRIEEKLGEGGIGVVYRARHALLRRPTAVKLLRREKVGEQTIKRFEREVRNTSRLTHPNTVAIYDYGRTPEGIFYYAMELLEGPNLGQIIEMDGPMPPARVIHVLVQCAGALAEAHGMGLVHRDVKPENIVLCRRGGVTDVVKVVDFGLVKDLETDEVKLSQANALTGTPMYLPPEAITAPDEVDGRSDLYQLGCLAWFLLVGSPPFEGNSAVEVCAKHLHQVPSLPSSHGRAVPADLEAIVMRLLQKKPEARIQRASELEQALRDCVDAGAWSLRDAEAWWQEHSVDVQEVLHSERTTALTIDIDRS